MGLTLKGSGKSAAPHWGSLPKRMRVLYITTYERTGGWLAEAFAADSASDVVLEEAVGSAAGVARLRDDVFDAVLISHEPGELDAPELVEVLRTGGSEEPIVVLGTANDPDMTALCLEANADAYVCVHATTTRTLIWTVARAIERHQLWREYRRLAQGERHRLEQEHQEAERLLAQQRALVCDLESLRGSTSPRALDSASDAAPLPPAAASAQRVELPPQLTGTYRDLLRAYVIMGSGNLAPEMSALAELLASAGVSSAQTVQLHLEVLEGLLRGLGNRSARHVMNRADLLALEIMVHLCEAYRRRCPST